MSSSHDPEGLEEGLRILRELGYLQGPAERFAVGRLRGGRRPAGAAAILGAFAGAISALLPMVGLLLTEPSLLARPLDSLLLLALLALCLGGVGALVLGSSIALWEQLPFLQKIPGRVFGWSGGLLIGLYAADVLGRAYPGRAGLAAAVLAAALFCLVAANAIRALLAAARWRGGRTRPRAVHSAQRLFPLLLGGVGAALLLIALPTRYEHLPRVDELKISTATAEPIRLIALEGIGPEELSWAHEQGVALLEGCTLAKIEAASPLTTWTSGATGVSPTAHGVGSWLREEPRGLASPVPALAQDPVAGALLGQLLPRLGFGDAVLRSARERRRATIWEALVEAGRRARIINWWGSWPAADHPRLEMATERFFPRLYEGLSVQDGLVSPVAFGTLAPSGAELGNMLLAIPAWTEAVELLQEAPADLRARWEYAISSDLFHLRLSEGIGDMDLFLYLNGYDIVDRALQRHTIAPGLGPERAMELRQLYLGFLWSRLPAGSSIALHAEDSLESAWWGGNFAMVPESLAMRLSERAGLSDLPADWGRPPAWGSSPAPRGEADLERLRSLGYIGGP